MKFGPVDINEAEGKILGHNIAGPDGRRLMRKGNALTAADIRVLREAGLSVIYVAELEEDDLDENAAAKRIALAAMGKGLRASGPVAGRVNLMATWQGLLRVDADRLTQLNNHEGITFATLAPHATVLLDQVVATVKIIPYALPAGMVEEAARVASNQEALLAVDELDEKSVGLILSGSWQVRERVSQGFEPPLRERIEALGSKIRIVDFITLEGHPDEIALGEKLLQHVQAGMDVIILAGETAIMDRHDIAPRAVERAGGELVCVGAPVDPGNLLMLAYLQDIPVLGAPGCARSRKTNVIDWVLPRLLAGDALRRRDIVQFGLGGLLEDTAKRPMPRNLLT
jgi:molybdenum cofactor cytidylyltransferase